MTIHADARPGSRTVWQANGCYHTDTIPLSSQAYKNSNARFPTNLQEHGHGVALRSRCHAQRLVQGVCRRWLCCRRRLKHESEDYAVEHRRYKKEPHHLPHNSSFHTVNTNPSLPRPGTRRFLARSGLGSRFLNRRTNKSTRIPMPAADPLDSSSPAARTCLSYC